MGYVQMTLDDWMQIKDRIRRELNNQKHSFVRTGYYLRRIRDEKLYLQDGYSSLSEFAKQEFNLGASYVSRMISINEKFSIDGYSEQMDPRFEDYRQGALTEMLALPEGDLQMITPQTSREDIRELKRFNAQEVRQTEHAGEQDPEAAEHDKLLAVVEDLCRQDREMVNDLFRNGLITDETKLAELINPSGGRTFKKSLYFISFTETAVKIKKFMKPPKDMTYLEFSGLIAEVLGPELSATKYEEHFGWPPEGESANVSEGVREVSGNDRKSEQSAHKPEQSAGGSQKQTEGEREGNEEKGNTGRAEAGSQGDMAADAADRAVGDRAGEPEENDERTTGVRENDRDTSEDIRRADREAGSSDGRCDQNIEGTAGGDDRNDQVSAAPGETGGTDSQDAELSSRDEWPEEWKPEGQGADPQTQEEQEIAGTVPVAPAQMNDTDPYAEIAGKMLRAVARMTNFINKRSWEFLKADLKTMDRYLKKAEAMKEEMECS